MIKVKVPSKLSPYTLEARHIKGYLFRRVNGIPVELMPQIRDLMAKFIQKAKEDVTIEFLIRKLDRLYFQKGEFVSIWTIEKNDKLVGYFYGEIARDSYEKVIVKIHNVYISPKAMKDELLKEVESILASWGRKIGAVAMEFDTERNPVAMAKRLSGGWDVESWRMRRCV